MFLFFYLTKSIIYVEQDGVYLYINGTGELSQNDFQKITKNNVQTAIIYEGITSLADETFSRFTNLINVHFPDSLLSIGSNIFQYTQINSLYIPQNVNRIKSISYLFYSDKFLKEIIVNTSNTKYASFDSCLYTRDLTTLLICPPVKTSINFPNVIKIIGTWAFYLSSIASLSIPDTVTNMSSMTFVDSTQIKSIIFGQNSNLMEIPSSCFWSSSFTNFECPPKVLRINSNSFYQTSLKKFTVMKGSTLRDLHYQCFYTCKSLHTVVLPSTIKYINNSAFIGCSSLENVTIEGDCEAYKTVNGSIFSADMSQLIFVPPKISSFEIPSDTEIVGESILQQCTQLSNLTVHPNNKVFRDYKLIIYSFNMSIAYYSSGNITNATIHKDTKTLSGGLFKVHPSLRYVNYEEGTKLEKIQSGCFSSASKIECIDFPDSVTSIESSAFQQCNIRRVRFGKNIAIVEMNLFYESKIEEFECDDNCLLERIKPQAFLRSPLRVFTFPSGLKRIDSRAFSETKLTDIKIKGKLETIEERAFYRCKNLLVVDINNTAPITSFLENAFNDCSQLHTVYIPKFLETIDSSCFQGCLSLSSIVFMGGCSLTTIKNSGFANCNFTTFSVPDTLTELYPGVFYGCSNLQTFVTESNPRFKAVDGIIYDKNCTTLEIYPQGRPIALIKENINHISENAFAYSKKLRSITFKEPTAILAFNSNTFLQCDNLESITIPSSVASLAPTTFSGCTSLTSFVVNGNSSIKTLESDLFKDCVKLQSVRFSGNGSLEEISDNLFAEKHLLETVKFSSPVSKIGRNAFSSCISLESFGFNVELESIGDSAFYGCSLLKNISLGPNVASIGPSAFSGCCNVLFLEISSGLNEIGDSAFCGLTSLEQIVYCGMKQFNQTNVFSDHNGLKVTALIAYPFKTIFGIECDKSMHKCHIYPTGEFSLRNSSGTSNAFIPSAALCCCSDVED